MTQPCREVLDPHCTPEVFANGIGTIEAVGPNISVTFFVNRRDPDGDTASFAVCRVVMCRDDLQCAVRQAQVALDTPARAGQNLLRVATHDAPAMLA